MNMKTYKTAYLYPDGGQAQGNPAPFGAWSFCIVDHFLPVDPSRGAGDGGTYGPRDHENDEVLFHEFGPMTPESIERNFVTNNNVELMALCKGILRAAQTLEHSDRLIICPDSLYAMRVYRNLCGVGPVPRVILEEVTRARAALKNGPKSVMWELISGHPERDIVIDGIKRKDNGRRYRVSKHNAAMDRHCTKICNDYIRNLDKTPL